MLRTTLGLSFILVLGGAAACSSKSTDDNNGSGGNGSIVGSAGSSVGGTTSNNGAGTSNASAGKTSTAGATGTGGSTGGGSGLCTDDTVTCTDTTHAMACNPSTGMVETFSCVDDLAALGFTSTGCTTDATGDACDISGVKDMACQLGTQAFAHCENATSDEQVFNIYVNCFQDNMDGHTIIPCFSEYVTATKMTANDCLRAEEACLPGAGGAGPGDPGTAGAGGAP